MITLRCCGVDCYGWHPSILASVSSESNVFTLGQVETINDHCKISSQRPLIREKYLFSNAYGRYEKQHSR